MLERLFLPGYYVESGVSLRFCDSQSAATISEEYRGKYRINQYDWAQFEKE